VADVFISHASVDVDRAREVAGLLAAAGYSVWWDDELRSGERFQESIIRELNDALAVVVLWSRAAIESDWVYSEARRGNKQDKLAQFRVGAVSIDELPAPFDVFHCPDVADDAALLAGVAAIARSSHRLMREPPLDSSWRSNLPAARTPIIGRETELTQLAEALERGEGLVTLTGPGGSGKTKLAIETARECHELFPSGVVFVGLATATDAPTAWGMVGEALGLPDAEGGREGVLAALGKGRRLLILDNLEQLEGAAEVVDAIVESAAGCALLATSRRALHVRGEREYLVSPLTVPAGGGLEAVRASGAVAMFVAHAQRVRRDFALTEQNADAVAELCRRLDGLPLAVELVAARVKFQPPAALLRRLDGLLDLASMTTQAEHRQATVRRTITWSYELLSPPQQRILECFGVFEGGADLDALDAVADDDDLRAHDVLELLYDLVDANLVSVHDTADGRTRFRVLETVRQFARDQLDRRGVLSDKVDAHAQFFYDLAGHLYQGSRSAQHSLTRVRFEEEVANLRAMLAATPVGVRDDAFYPGPVPLSHLVVLVAWVCLRFGHVRDAYLVLTEAGVRPEVDPYADVATRLAFGDHIRLLPEVSLDAAYLETTRTMAAALPDAHLPPWVEPTNLEFFARRHLVILAQETEDLRHAEELCADLVAFAQARGTKRHRALADEALAYQAYRSGDLERAHTYLGRELRYFEEIGDVRQLAICTNNLADVELMMGRPAEAAARLVAGTEQVVALGDLETFRVYLQTFAQVIGVRAPLLVAKADGAASSVSETTGLAPEGSEPQHLHESVLAPVRATVPAPAWTAAVEEGRATPAAAVLRELAQEATGLF
jgi:predicted ATPase